uniref:Uncharacterized protein n=1 Tax=Anguilla anguilla TaxID=7936 RepID=A0A0E9S525_ANGAN
MAILSANQTFSKAIPAANDNQATSLVSTITKSKASMVIHVANANQVMMVLYL